MFRSEHGQSITPVTNNMHACDAKYMVMEVISVILCVGRRVYNYMQIVTEMSLIIDF